jgi:16S rRNA (guanine527-N7)-methyltransferase
VTTGVSRETPPPPPPAAHAVFGSTVTAAAAYAELLGSLGVEWGLLGPREVPRLWDRHLLNCAVVAPTLPDEATVADVGSGAGLPGLVWSICRPDLAVTLIEPMARRVRFLETVVERLGLDRVRIVRARAEDRSVGHEQDRYDVVTARAVARLDRLGRWCLPLVRPGGQFVAFKGAAAADELAAALPTLRQLGATASRIAIYGEGVLEIPTRAVVVSVAPGDPAHAAPPPPDVGAS